MWRTVADQMRFTWTPVPIFRVSLAAQIPSPQFKYFLFISSIWAFSFDIPFELYSPRHSSHDLVSYNSNNGVKECECKWKPDDVLLGNGIWTVQQREAAGSGAVRAHDRCLRFFHRLQDSEPRSFTPIFTPLSFMSPSFPQKFPISVYGLHIFKSVSVFLIVFSLNKLDRCVGA